MNEDSIYKAAKDLTEPEKKNKETAPPPSALNTQVGGAHYRERPIQPVEYIEANSLPFLEGCIVKRITRHDSISGGGIRDLEKIKHEVDLIIELRYGGAVDDPAG